MRGVAQTSRSLSALAVCVQLRPLSSSSLLRPGEETERERPLRRGDRGPPRTRSVPGVVVPPRLSYKSGHRFLSALLDIR